MSINFKESILLPFSEPRGIVKVIIGGIILLIASVLQNISILQPVFKLGKDVNYIFILLSGLGIILSLGICGYCAQAANNYLKEDEYIVMPEWDKIGDYCIIGLLVALVSLIYSIPAIILYTAGVLVLFANPAGMIMALPLFVIALILQLILLPAALMIFVKDLKISDIFNMNFLSQIIIKNLPGLIIIDLLILFALFLYVIAIIFSLFLLTPFIIFMMNLAVFNLYAQGAQDFLADEQQ